MAVWRLYRPIDHSFMEEQGTLAEMIPRCLLYGRPHPESSEVKVDE
jgi:hypothetical protein